MVKRKVPFQNPDIRLRLFAGRTGIFVVHRKMKKEKREKTKSRFAGRTPLLRPWVTEERNPVRDAIAFANFIDGILFRGCQDFINDGQAVRIDTGVGCFVVKANIRIATYDQIGASFCLALGNRVLPGHGKMVGVDVFHKNEKRKKRPHRTELMDACQGGVLEPRGRKLLDTHLNQFGTMWRVFQKTNS